jgi:hypothetical protein
VVKRQSKNNTLAFILNSTSCKKQKNDQPKFSAGEEEYPKVIAKLKRLGTYVSQILTSRDRSREVAKPLPHGMDI